MCTERRNRVSTPRIRPEVFVGECNDQVAHIYVRLARPCHEGDSSLTARFRGPSNVYGHTLATNYPFASLGPGDTTLLRAIVPDPCPWSPLTPTLYEYWIKDDLGAFPPIRRQEFGIRQFAPHGPNLVLQGKRWVPRGMHDDHLMETLEMWRFRAGVRVTRSFDEVLFAEASRAGVMIMFEMDDEALRDIKNVLIALSDFAAVAMVLIPAGSQLSETIRRSAPNIVLVQQFDGSDALQPWAHAVSIDATSIRDFAEHCTTIKIPIIAERRYRGTSLAEARSAIDTLQADLAPIGQFAGYVV